MTRRLIVAALVLALPGLLVAASAARLGVTSNNMTVMTADVSVPRPMKLTIANKVGGTAGKPEQGDTISVEFSEAIDPISVCNGWTGSGPKQVSVSLSADDHLTVADAGECTVGSGRERTAWFRFAESLPLGGNYNGDNTKSVTFDGAAGTAKSAISLSSDKRTLTVTLGTPCTGGPCGNLVQINAGTKPKATFTVDQAIKTASGGAFAGSIDSTEYHF